MAKEKITEITKDLLDEFLKANGLELYDIKFVKEGPDWFLKIFIEKIEEGKYISTEDCEKVSKFLSEKLDEKDPIEQNYYLEVSSPGLDRELSRTSHFKKFIGSDIEVRLFKNLDGRKKYEGKLIEAEDEKIVIERDSKEALEIPREEISKANLLVTF